MQKIISNLLTVALCLLSLSAWGGEQRQMCRGCHPSHYAGRNSCVGCHRGSPDSDRKNIAHHRLIVGRFASFTLGDTATVREGNRLMGQFACRRCHVSGGRGNRLATPLDTLISARTPEEIAAALRSPGQGMPDFRLTEDQSVALVNAVLAGAKQGGKQGGERPLLLHFEAGDKKNEDIFTRKCGPCHRALTVRLGVLGRGAIGPNLSGLLSAWYPHTFGEGRPWSAERLRHWLKNPRTSRRWARMQPVELTTAEFRELVTILEVPQE